jgi:hypothetical protein
MHKMKRAMLISKSELLEGCPGSIVVAEIEVKNCTHWGWKKGVFLGMDTEQNLEGMPIEVVQFPIEQDVKSFEVLKLAVPISIVQDAVP